MIDIKDCKDKCFALVFNQCKILTETNCENCSFYKPRRCEDWVRVVIDGRVMLYTPEEYEERRRERTIPWRCRRYDLGNNGEMQGGQGYRSGSTGHGR